MKKTVLILIFAMAAAQICRAQDNLDMLSAQKKETQEAIEKLRSEYLTAHWQSNYYKVDTIPNLLVTGATLTCLLLLLSDRTQTKASYAIVVGTHSVSIINSLYQLIQGLSLEFDDAESDAARGSLHYYKTSSLLNVPIALAVLVYTLLFRWHFVFERDNYNRRIERGMPEFISLLPIIYFIRAIYHTLRQVKDSSYAFKNKREVLLALTAEVVLASAALVVARSCYKFLQGIWRDYNEASDIAPLKNQLHALNQLIMEAQQCERCQCSR